MRKGLTTLMTVAIALVSVQALALAPTIGQIPSPIVGNQQTGTQVQKYTYPDAFDLHALASDDNTASNQLKWSYEIVGTVQKYSINGDAPINSVTENVVAPPAAKTINTQWNGVNHADAGNDPNPDTLVNTVTIRNVDLYPYGGTPNSDQTVPNQSWALHMQPVTFWCSDGSLATSSTVMFYTDNTYTAGQPTGWNRLSNVNPWTMHKQDAMTNTNTNWYMYDPFTGWDNHTTSNTWTDGKGLCLTVTQSGQNWGSMATPIGFVTLIDNMVYRIRLKMNCTQLTAGKTPFWDFILENWNGDGTKGQNFYGVDNYFLDNTGGANAIVNTTAGTEVTMLFAPAAFQTAQWKSTVSGIFAQNPAPPTGNGIDYSKVRDAALRFRVLDLDVRNDLGNSQKFGSICLQNVIVETCPFSRKVYEATGTTALPTTSLYEAASLKAAHANPPPPGDQVKGNVSSSSLLGSTMSYAGGILTIAPSAAGRQAEIVTVAPATDLLYTETNWATISDDWPIPWETNKMYELKVEMSAPDATQAAHPWDVLWMNMEPPTNEVITESYVTANKGFAMPKNGTPQSYYMFYHSNSETKSNIAAYHFLRWRIRFGNSTNNDWPNASDTENTGSVRIHSIRVNKILFK